MKIPSCFPAFQKQNPLFPLLCQKPYRLRQPLLWCCTLLFFRSWRAFLIGSVFIRLLRFAVCGILFGIRAELKIRIAVHTVKRFIRIMCLLGKVIISVIFWGFGIVRLRFFRCTVCGMFGIMFWNIIIKSLLINLRWYRLFLAAVVTALEKPPFWVARLSAGNMIYPIDYQG